MRARAGGAATARPRGATLVEFGGFFLSLHTRIIRLDQITSTSKEAPLSGWHLCQRGGDRGRVRGAPRPEFITVMGRRWIRTRRARRARRMCQQRGWHSESAHVVQLLVKVSPTREEKRRCERARAWLRRPRRPPRCSRSPRTSAPRLGKHSTSSTAKGRVRPCSTAPPHEAATTRCCMLARAQA